MSIMEDQSPISCRISQSRDIIPASMRGTQSSQGTPSRKGSQFRSVRDMLFLEDSPCSSPMKDSQEDLPAPGKLKRPSKSSVLSIKSTNSKTSSATSLGTKDGKIFGQSTKISSVSAVSKTTAKDPSCFDVYAIPSSPPPSSQRLNPQVEPDLPDTPPHETNKPPDYIPAKRVWTPVKENSKPEVIDLCSPDDPKAPLLFTSRLSAFRHEDVVPTAMASLRDNSEPPTKRVCLQMLEIGNKANKGKVGDEGTSKKPVKKVAKPTKPRAKKAKTITDLALAPYAPAEPEPTQPPPVTQSLVEEKVDTVGEAKATKRKAKKKATPKKVTAKKVVKQPVLLSPRSVKMKMDQQTFVFGTSSQVSKQDPPTDGWKLETTGQKLNTIQTHAKIHTDAVYDLCDIDDMEDIPDVGETDQDLNRRDTVFINPECTLDSRGWGVCELDIIKTAAAQQNRANTAKKGSLWSLGSRGLDGGLEDIEVLDLVDEDDLEKILSQVSSQKASNQARKSSVTISNKASRALPGPAQIPTPATTQTSTEKSDFGSGEPQIRWETLSFNAPLTPAESQPTQTETGQSAELPPIITDSESKAHPEDEPTNAGRPLRPNFEGYTLAQLQVQIAKYGFKAVKSRNTMIDMLNRCWDSAEANRAARNQEEDVEKAEPKEAKAKPAKGKKKKEDVPAKTGDAEPVPVPKKRGRKPKPAVETIDGVETPKPKRARKSLGDTETPASGKKPKADMPGMFKHIAAAIKHQPTSPGLTRPSWWQKILMNETIVLEEFAEWLVQSGLKEAGVADGVWEELGISESGEGVVDVKKVAAIRKWCEARSVVWVKRKSAKE